MTQAEYLSILPEKAGKHIQEYAQANLMHELGNNMMVFKSELIRYSPEYTDFLIYENAAKGKTERAASCTCTACGETFYCGWLPKETRTRYGVSMIQGEDGNLYTGIPSGNESVEFLENDEVTCPICGTYSPLVHSSRLNRGKVFQIAVSEVSNLGNLTAIITWLVKRTVYKSGKPLLDVLPFGAVVLDGKKLLSFKHFGSGMFGNNYYIDEWEMYRRFQDPTECCYYDSQSFYSKKRGAFIYPDVPDLTGASAEKTGLAKYIEIGGAYPAEYLKEWKKHPNIENLVCTGWEPLVVDYIYRCRNSYIFQLSCFWHKRKPHEMLAMSKADYKALSQESWDTDKTNTWLDCKANNMPFSASGFEEEDIYFVKAYLSALKKKSVTASEYYKVKRYVQKQKYNSDARAFEYLADHWRMTSNRLEAEGIDRPLTHEERFPRNIMQAHEQDLQFIKASADKELQKKFDSVFNTYQPIEWTDGELCIRIPHTEQELITEGEILRHCVGSYGKEHARGNKIIFFVRRFRRPERSYYTLNIDFSGKEPREVQLHGYGNERHGKNKEYTHSIPKKVRDFVDKWENEVMMPWAMKQIKENEKNAKKSA